VHTPVAAESNLSMSRQRTPARRNVPFTLVFVRRLPAIQLGCSPRGRGWGEWGRYLM